MTATPERQAWTDVLARLELLADEFDDRSAEGLEHVIDQTVLWLGWEALHADATRPFFQRHNDLVGQWGGPNADNVYRHARVECGRRYRVRGRMHSCDEFLLAVRAGFMHRPEWGTLHTITASDLGIGPGDDFELLFGGDDPDAVPLPEGAVMISIREYYFDWTADEPATFTIECLDPEPTASVTGELLSHRLREAVDEIEQSLTYWNRYLLDNRADRTDNSFSANTVKVGKGLTVARYEFCFWRLEPDEALIIVADQPDARYWAVQLYMLGTFELVDPYGAITSRNHRQTDVDPDGKVRFVLSATDPGVANWLDTTGRREGLCTFRWFWPRNSTAPDLQTRVMPIDQVSGILSNRRSVLPAERADELRSRQDHLRWRFRT